MTEKFCFTWKGITADRARQHFLSTVRRIHFLIYRQQNNQTSEQVNGFSFLKRAAHGRSDISRESKSFLTREFKFERKE
jgi:hypothetical protein